MEKNNQEFKTLRIIDGKEYVELSEVKQILKTMESMESIPESVAKFQKAVQDLQDSFKNMKL